jgi:hypothetical protein
LGETHHAATDHQLLSRDLQAYAHIDIVAGGENFSLNSPELPHGIFGDADYGKPLAMGVFDAVKNPLWVILNASFNPPPTVHAATGAYVTPSPSLSP